MRSHTKLDAWKRSTAFAVDIYRLTERFPKDERYGLTSQLRRAAVSIPANIAEGAARSSKKDYRRFLSNAQGSASEAQTELLIAYRLGYLTREEYIESFRTLDDIGKMITGLSKRLRKEIEQSDSQRTNNDSRLTIND